MQHPTAWIPLTSVHFLPDVQSTYCVYSLSFNIAARPVRERFMRWCWDGTSTKTKSEQPLSPPRLSRLPTSHFLLPSRPGLQPPPAAHVRQGQLALRVELTPPESKYVGGGGVFLDSVGKTITPGMGSGLVLPAKIRRVNERLVHFFGGCFGEEGRCSSRGRLPTPAGRPERLSRLQTTCSVGFPARIE